MALGLLLCGANTIQWDNQNSIGRPPPQSPLYSRATASTASAALRPSIPPSAPHQALNTATTASRLQQVLSIAFSVIRSAHRQQPPLTPHAAESALTPSKSPSAPPHKPISTTNTANSTNSTNSAISSAAPFNTPCRTRLAAPPSTPHTH